MDVSIVNVSDPGEKRRVARAVLEALTDWFEIEETREANPCQVYVMAI